MSSMTKSDVVFRYRFWLFSLIFWAGFALYGVDHTNASVAILRLVVPGIDVDGGGGRLTLQGMFGVAAACVVLAALVRTWATAYLQSSVVFDTKMHSESLVASGPYRYVRNPLYLGGLLLAVGFGLTASRLGCVVILVGITTLSLALIRSEERLMARTHPASFAAYRGAVPRLVPALTARLPEAAGLRPSWAQALAGESFFWIFAVGVIMFAITLRSTWVVWGAIVGVAFHLVIIGAMRARRARAST